MTFLSPALVDRTAEAVGPGHPDKFCDHVVAGILQYCLEQDRTALVNVECSIDPDAIRLSGVIHATQGLMQSRFDDVVAQTIDLCGMRPLQYDSTWEIHDKVVRFEHATNDASDEGLCGKLTAVDQGVAFGYATDELVALQALRGLNHLPLNVTLAHSVVKRLDQLRVSLLPWLWSDMKVQVTVSYTEDRQSRRWKPSKVAEIVVTAQHDGTVALAHLRRCIMTDAVIPVLKSHGAWELCDKATEFLIQPYGDKGVVPSGKPSGHSGAKRAVDLYGDWTPTGGAVWGKTAHHVDVLGATLARAIATFLITKGLVSQCQIQVRTRPGSEEVECSFYAYDHPSFERDQQLRSAISEEFDMRLSEVEKRLDLGGPHLFTAMNECGRLVGYHASPWEFKGQS